MDVRKAGYNENGTIDCEVEHPVYGWIPFTASHDDSEVHGREIHAALLVSGNVADYEPPTQVELDAIAQVELDQVKESKRSELIQQKMALSLVTEFAEIDAARTEDELNLIAIR